MGSQNTKNSNQTSKSDTEKMQQEIEFFRKTINLFLNDTKVAKSQPGDYTALFNEWDSLKKFLPANLKECFYARLIKEIKDLRVLLDSLLNPKQSSDKAYKIEETKAENVKDEKGQYNLSYFLKLSQEYWQLKELYWAKWPAGKKEKQNPIPVPLFQVDPNACKEDKTELVSPSVNPKKTQNNPKAVSSSGETEAEKRARETAERLFLEEQAAKAQKLKPTQPEEKKIPTTSLSPEMKGYYDNILKKRNDLRKRLEPFVTVKEFGVLERAPNPTQQDFKELSEEYGKLQKKLAEIKAKEKEEQEAAAQLEAEKLRKAQEEAARLEAEKKAQEEARKAAELKAAQEAAALAAQKKAQEEAARLEAEKKAQEEARKAAELKATQEKQPVIAPPQAPTSTILQNLSELASFLGGSTLSKDIVLNNTQCPYIRWKNNDIDISTLVDLFISSKENSVFAQLAKTRVPFQKDSSSFFWCVVKIMQQGQLAHSHAKKILEAFKNNQIVWLKEESNKESYRDVINQFDDVYYAYLKGIKPEGIKRADNYPKYCNDLDCQR